MILGMSMVMGSASLGGASNIYTQAFAAAKAILVSSGTWPKLDVLNFYNAPNQSTALTNLESANYPTTNNGAATFVAGQGFSNASVGDLQIPYPLNLTTQFTSAAASYFVWTNNAAGSLRELALMSVAGNALSNSLFPRYTADDHMYLYINSADQNDPGVVISPVGGMYGGVRNGTSLLYYQNGVNIYTYPAGAPVAVPNDIFLNAHNGYPGTTYGFAAGGALTGADVTALNLAMATYVAMIGRPNFASDGAGYFDNTVGRPAFYDATKNRTWVSWMGWENPGSGNKYVTVVSVLDHRTNLWSTNVQAGTNSSLVNDPHGAPSISNMHANGWTYIGYGTHAATDMRLTRNTTAFSPAVWDDTGTLAVATYGSITFQKLFVVGNNLYVFYITDGSGSGTITNEGAIAYTVLAINTSTGALTPSGTFKKALSIGNNGWILPGTFMLRSNGRIAMTWSVGTAGVGVYPIANVYYGELDPATGTLYNSGGGFSVVVGSQPISQATMDTNFKIYTGTSISGIAALIEDDANAMHALFSIDAVLPSQLIHITDANGWTPEVVFTYNISVTAPAGASICKAPSGGVAAYWPDGLSADTLYAQGAGNMLKAVRSSGGVWGSTSTVLAKNSTYSLANPVSVINGSANGRMLFSEVSSDGLATPGDTKGYMTTDAGFATRTF